MKKDKNEIGKKNISFSQFEDIPEIEKKVDGILAEKKDRLGKKGESARDVSESDLEKVDVAESGGHDGVVSEVDGLIGVELSEGVDEGEAGLLDEKVEEVSEVGESVEEEDVGGVKAVELAEKHRFFKMKKKSSKVEKKKEEEKVEDVDLVPSLPDDLIDFKELPEDLEAKKVRRRRWFGKKKGESARDVSESDLEKVDVAESGGHDGVVSEVDGLIGVELSEGVDEGEAGLLDEKVEEVSEVGESVGEEDVGGVKAVELAEKHRFFKMKKKSSKVEKKKEEKVEDVDLVPSLPDDLSKLEKKYEGRFTFSDTTSVEGKTDEIKKDEVSLLDERISEKSPTEDIEEKEITSVETEFKKPKKKKSFFKRKKPSKVEKVKQKEEKKEPKKWKGDLRFRVENLPKVDDVSEDEAKLLDEKIKKTPETSESAEKEDAAEIKAIKLAEEHIKDKSMPIAEMESSIPGPLKKQKDAEDVKEISKPVLDVSQDKDDLEHAFFDEADSSFGGWSPQLTEKEKKDVLSPHTEIEPQDIELPKDVLQTKSIKLSDLGFSEKEWEELDFYPLRDPFAFVEILREKETLDKRYFLVEVELTAEEQRLLKFINETLGKLTIDSVELEKEGGDRYIMKKIEHIVEDYDIKLDDESKAKILYFFKNSALGLGKIDPLMKDPNIEDISCDGANVPIFLYHRQYGSLKSNIEFKSEEELSSFVFKLAQKCGKHISIAEPMLDATMPDGSRIQMTLSDEVTSKGSTFTIRKFREDPFSPPDLVEFNTMSGEMVAYMWLAVENGINALIAGGTASGKTTILNALSLFIPRESKIVSIEETREINLPHPNWIPGVSRSGFGEVIADKVVGEIDLYDLMKAALRQRPEYILVGEIRGREAYVLFQAMATGHATFSTVHADSAQSLIHRLEGKPINIPRVMLQSLDIITLHVITRVKNKRARRCKQIIEIIDIDPTTKEILTNEVFRWDPVEDKFVYSGKSYVLERIRAEKDISGEEMTNEIKNRAEIIEWMNENNIRQFREVSKIVSQYIENPDELLKQIKRS